MLEKKTIYLDYQASTPLDKDIFDVMLPYWKECFANPNSNDHFLGWKSNQAIQKARRQISLLLNSDPDEIVFTSGATESNNFLIKGLSKHLKKIKKTKLITTSIEHKSVLSCFEYLGEEGFDVIYLRPNTDGVIEIEKLQDVIDEKVGLVSIMMVNNEIGTVQPISKLSEIAHKNGSFFHTDASQAPIFIKMDVQLINADMISFSSHKIYGPKGVGGAFIRKGLKSFITPLLHGGKQEDGLRSGTLPTPLCVGFGEACYRAYSNVVENRKKLKNLSNLFLQELQKQIPSIKLNGSKKLRHPGNLNIYFSNINAQDFLQRIQPYISASTGSACNSGVESPSYVLNEIGLSVYDASSSVRFSFGKDQTFDEIINAVNIIYEEYKNYIHSPHCSSPS